MNWPSMASGAWAVHSRGSWAGAKMTCECFERAAGSGCSRSTRPEAGEQRQQYSSSCNCTPNPLHLRLHGAAAAAAHPQRGHVVKGIAARDGVVAIAPLHHAVRGAQAVHHRCIAAVARGRWVRVSAQPGGNPRPKNAIPSLRCSTQNL